MRSVKNNKITMCNSGEKKECKGRYTRATPDQILEELNPSPARWTHLAALVIATVEEGQDAEVLATDPRLLGSR